MKKTIRRIGIIPTIALFFLTVFLIYIFFYWLLFVTCVAVMVIFFVITGKRPIKRR